MGIASATRTRTRLLVGVEVNGLTVCPCAQDMVRDQSLDRLRENGYSEEEGERILEPAARSPRTTSAAGARC